MKKLILIIATLSLYIPIYGQTCYYYITARPTKNFEVHDGEILKRIFTQVFRTNCEELEAAIENEFRDYIKSEYPKTHFYVDYGNEWKFKTESGALKERRKEIGRLKDDGYKIIELEFEYYGNN